MSTNQGSNALIEKLQAELKEALAQVSKADELSRLEEVRIEFLGKKGKFSEVLRGLGQLSAEERPRVGSEANKVKDSIESALTLRKQDIGKRLINARLDSEKIDVTMPARKGHLGSLHPLTLVTRRVIEIFSRIGFTTITGPEVETEFLNFEAVNIPKDHPARDMQDTFFAGPGVVLRTHTTAVQIRAMRTLGFPIRALCPGAVFRNDRADATHSPMFHQVEGLWVDEGIRMSDLKGVLEYFAREMFGAETKIRLRPSYFPFTEPSAEVDVTCFNCKGRGDSDCRICKGSAWIEILGAGMVHPSLFGFAGFSGKKGADKLSGFAFGLGVERVAMLLERTPDIRHFFQGDVRFLQQYS